MNKYIIITLCMAAAAVICTLVRPLHKIRAVIIKMFSGFALLISAVAFAGTALPIGVNLFTVLTSLTLGVPGTLGMIAVSMIL